MKLRIRFAVAMLATGGFGVGCLVLHHAWTSSRMLHERARSRADAIAEALAQETAATLGAGDVEGARRAGRAFASLPSVRYLTMEDARGFPIFNDGQPRVGVDERVESAAPIVLSGKRLGMVHVGISTSRIRSNVETVVYYGAILGICTLGLLSLASWRIGLALGRKLEQLAAAAARIDEIDPDTLPDLGSESEVGRLSRAFRLLHRRLEAEERARRAAEAEREDFTDMLVHDLKHPLTVMKIVLDSLGRAESRLGDGERGIMRLAERSVDRLDAMTNDLLQIAKLEHAQAAIRRVRTHVGAFLSECVEENALMVERAGAAWSLTIEPDAAARWIYADRAMIRRVLGNLVLNAVDHAPEGSRVSFEVRTRGADHVIFIVRDEGPGVPLERVQEIFEKYRTFDSASRNVGLGLAFCKLAAGLHAARLEVVDLDRPGAAFALALPTMAPAIEQTGGEHERRESLAGKARERETS